MNPFSRSHPYLARIKERTLLTAPHSTKKTYHLCLEASLPYQIGDSIGILPTNDPGEVDQILTTIRATGDEEVFDKRAQRSLPLREFLLHKANLVQVTTAFLKRLLEQARDRTEFLTSLLQDKALLTHYLHSHTLIEILQAFPNIAPSDLAQTLLPLLPRFYSIANSAKVHPGEIHLLVAYVEYHLNTKIRRGVGSHFLCNLAALTSAPIPIYVQPSHHFTLPPPDASMILIGPGTGLAPFRAFLQERLATQSLGRNWLFFGERNFSSDFYYESFWRTLEKQHRLRLDLAFSRDTPQKIYVQHRMYEQRKSFWNWIEQGSYVYVCGDAQKMAKAVDTTLHQIICEEGNMSPEDALHYLKTMRAERRYLTDVY